MRRAKIIYLISGFISIAGVITLRATGGKIQPSGATIDYQLPAPEVRFVTKFASATTGQVTVRTTGGLVPFPVPNYTDTNRYGTVLVSTTEGTVRASFSLGANPGSYDEDWEVAYTGIYGGGFFLRWDLTTATGLSAAQWAIFLADATTATSTRLTVYGKTWEMSNPMESITVKKETRTPGSTFWEEATPIAFNYPNGGGGVARQDCEYKVVTSPTLRGTKVFWLEIFTPVDGSAKQYIIKEWSIVGKESPVFRLKAPAGSTAAVEMISSWGELAVDADRDGTIILASEGASDATSKDQPFRFWLNDDGALFKVNGDADLVNYFPVFLDIAELLKTLPTRRGYTYKLSQADNAVRFIYTSLSVDRAFDYLRPPRPKTAVGTSVFQIEPLTTGFGYVEITQDLNWTAPQRAEKTVVTTAGVPLITKWLDAITPETKLGVLLFDGRALTKQPLVLTVTDINNVTVASISLPLEISNVEDMYRHLNLREGPDVLTALVDAGSSDAGRPSNYTIDPPGFPDAYNNNDWVLQMHGYNVSGEKARSWESGVFKNLYWSHSHAKFVGVCWLGDPRDSLWGSLPNYHAGARNAMLLAPSLAKVINNNFTGGKVTTITHSQSCMMVGTAIADTEAKIDHAIFVDAALAQECYDGTDDENLHDMTVSTWADTDPNTDVTTPRYSRKLWATDWWKNFPTSDHRHDLTWQNRFRDPLSKIYNFYSPTENVLDKDAKDAGWVVADLAASIVLTLGGDLGHFSWVAQEKTKGNVVQVGISLGPLPYVASGSYYMGWGFNLTDPISSDDPIWYDVTLFDTERNGFKYVRTLMGPADVNNKSYTPGNIAQSPLFLTGWGVVTPPNADRGYVSARNVFLVQADWAPNWILDLYSDNKGSKTAEDHRDQLLCEAIPALSLPLGANRVRVFSPDGPDVASDRNFNIPLLFVDPNHWPRGSDSRGDKLPIWFHGDMHDQAYVYTYGFYDKLVSIISQ